MEAKPHRPTVVVPKGWAPQLQQAIDDALRREADMIAHLQSQLDGPTLADIADWGECG